MATPSSSYDPLAQIPRTNARGQAGFIDDVRWAGSVAYYLRLVLAAGVDGALIPMRPRTTAGTGLMDALRAPHATSALR